MTDTVDGLVLCRVGDHRLAFAAREVTAIDLWASNFEGVPYARSAYQLPRAPGRLVIQNQTALVVDALEINSDPSASIAVPPVLAHAAGGALAGFVVVSGQLWPLMTLQTFARYLERQATVAA